MGLDIDVFCAFEELLGAFDCQAFGGVDVFGSGVVTASGIAFGVFVCQDGSCRFEDSAAGVVLGSDEDDLLAETAFLGGDDFRYFGVSGLKVQCVARRFLTGC